MTTVHRQLCCDLCGSNMEHVGGRFESTTACRECLDGLADPMAFYRREMRSMAFAANLRGLHCMYCCEIANGFDEIGSSEEGGVWVHCRKCDVWTHHPDNTDEDKP